MAEGSNPYLDILAADFPEEKGLTQGEEARSSSECSVRSSNQECLDETKHGEFGGADVGSGLQGLSARNAVTSAVMSFKRVTELCLPKELVVSMNKSKAQGDSTCGEDLDIIAEALLKLKVARLGWQGFEAICNLDALTSIEDLYLEHNMISRIENLELLRGLKFLALQHNKITEIGEGLKHLKRLELLDLSYNLIENVEVSGLPSESLRNVDLSGNPCADLTGYRDQLTQGLPNLVILDDHYLYEAESNDTPSTGTLEGEHDGEGKGKDEREFKQEDLLNRSNRTTPRKTISGTSRSDAMMDAAICKIEEMSASCQLITRGSLNRRRGDLAARSKARMDQEKKDFAERLEKSKRSMRQTPQNLENKKQTSSSDPSASDAHCTDLSRLHVPAEEPKTPPQASSREELEEDNDEGGDVVRLAPQIAS